MSDRTPEQEAKFQAFSLNLSKQIVSGALHVPESRLEMCPLEQDVQVAHFKLDASEGNSAFIGFALGIPMKDGKLATAIVSASEIMAWIQAMPPEHLLLVMAQTLHQEPIYKPEAPYAHELDLEKAFSGGEKPEYPIL